MRSWSRLLTYLLAQVYHRDLPRVHETVPVWRYDVLGRSGKSCSDERARFGWIDHVVQLEELRGVDRLRVLLRGRGHLAYALLTRLVVLDRLELLAQPQPHRPLEAHRAQMRRRPGDREHRLVQAAGHHRLRSQAVATAQYHGDERHVQRRAGDQQ